MRTQSAKGSVPNSWKFFVGTCVFLLILVFGLLPESKATLVWDDYQYVADVIIGAEFSFDNTSFTNSLYETASSTMTSPDPPPAQASVADAGMKEIGFLNIDTSAEAVADEGYLYQRAEAAVIGDDPSVTELAYAFAHSGFRGWFTATCPAYVLTYDITYDISESSTQTTGLADLVYFLEIRNETTGEQVFRDDDLFVVQNSAESDTISNSVQFEAVLGNQYFLNIATGPAVDVNVYDGDTGIAEATTTFAISCVPEPTTMLLLGTGLVGLVGFRKKFKK